MITSSLSKSQYGIYVECANNADKACYNIPYCYTLDGSLNAERLRLAIETAIKAHPTLFTRIAMREDGEPEQRIEESEISQYQLELSQCTDIQAEIADFIRPFSIVGDRLFRIRLLQDATHFYILQDIHHIISDGASRKLLLSDIEKAYLGQSIQPEEITQAQVAKEEEALRRSAQFEEDKRWYASNFDCQDCDSPFLPDLEGENPEEGLQTRIMDVASKAVDDYCKSHGIYRSTFFTAVYAFLLAKYNNEQQVLFSTIHNGRADKRKIHTLAMLVQTFPVYARFDNNTSVLDFIRATQEQMRGCRTHEAYAFSDVVTEMGLQPATTFAWHGDLFDTLTFDSKPITAKRLNNNTIDTGIYIKSYLRDNHYCVEAEYAANLYSKELVSQFLASYEVVVEAFMTIDKLCDIDITSDAQKEVLDSFNQQELPYDDSQTIVSLVSKQVALHPEKIAVVYKDKRYTYREIDAISTRLAQHIVSRGMAREDVVAILIPRCEWMPIAALGVLKAGCAFQPLDPSYPKERLNFMIQDTKARLLIAEQELLSIMEDYTGEVLLTKDIPSLPAMDVSLPEIHPEDLFTLIYTSGSTGVPKGGMSEHRNWVAFCMAHMARFDFSEQTRFGAYASFGFDASPMEIFTTLIAGGEVHIIPEELRLDLVALNDYFEANGITIVFMTTQVAYQFATNIENHSLKYLLTGGEKLASLTPPKNYVISNGYGPSETICYVSTYNVLEKRKNIPIGTVLANTHIYIVDGNAHRVPIGACGELWISGPQVSRGYLNQPEKTAQAYIPNPFSTDPKHARIYRSGDIVRYLPDGNIEFVGRRDGQVKIRGFRIELKEVEAVIREFNGIKDATVQAFDIPGEGAGKFIAAYIVGDQPIDIQALNDFILEHKPPYMVPAVTMQIDAIPLNQNQKVNKKALPKPEMKQAEVVESNVPMNRLEQELHDIIASIVNSTDFGITTLLGYVGLTSISAIKLAVQVQKRYGVTLDAKSLSKTGTLQTIENEILARLLDTEAEPIQSSTEHSSQELPIALSYAQTGVYFECMKNPTSTIYNIPCLLAWPEGVDTNAISAALKQLVENHPEMRVSFSPNGDQVVQKIDASIVPEVTMSEMTETQLEEYKSIFVQPFNLAHAPLYRFEIVKTERGIYLLMDVHHLVFDGGSMDLFIHQLCDLLEGKTVEKETYSYLDFSRNQQKAEQTDAFLSSKAFFAERLGECEGASEIPADLPKTDQQGFIGEAVCKADFDKVNTFCRIHQITPAHLFLAAVSYVTSRYTNNRAVYLSTISSGRSNLKIADTVGMFVNTLALGLKVEDVSVEEYLQHVSSCFDETLRHEDYPFARIAADYAFVPAITYAYQVGVISQYTLNGKPVGQEVLELKVPKFKINIKIEPRGVVVQYDDSCYSARLGNALAESIVAVVEHMIASPKQKIRSISIISENQEKELDSKRQVSTGKPAFTFFHDCISHYARHTPERLALIACDGQYTYAEFDAITNRVANNLLRLGVTPRSRVALLLPRTSRVMIAMFGTLKAGCAYIPCDPEYPTERIQHILTDSHAAYILTTSDRVSQFNNAINVEQLLDGPDDAPQVDITPDDLAYLIYTSGSTGKPKGVMLRHEGICNYLTPDPGNSHIYAIATRTNVIASVTTLSFDMSLKEFGGAFCCGKTFVLANEEQTTNPILLAELFKQTGTDAFNATPSRMMGFMELPAFREAISQCRVLMCGGEKYADGLLPMLRVSAPHAQIFNTYGPTEITVSSNCKDLTHTDIISIGPPLMNYIEFVVDSDGNELPVGVVGELYIGGIGVAKGYNDLPEMTAERFIDYKGVRIYKSGDYARWTEEGDVVILGRTDNQIKLRGLRIELGEVEATLNAVQGIKNVVVKICKIKGAEHLCAYFTADHKIDIADLKAELGKTLTKYMVPTAYLQMDKMPLTPNGKTDIKNLPEPEIALSGDYVAPANDTERAFCEIYADILKIEKVSATDNFFEIGGTSLAVMQIVVQAERKDMHIAYRDVFDRPTPRLLAAMITGDTMPDESEATDLAAQFDYNDINALLTHNTLDAFREGERKELGNVLLTGSTGYLGIHILRELLDSEAKTIYCLVRGKTREAAERRLTTLLYYYFALSYKQLIGTRIRVLTGDVTDDIASMIRTQAPEAKINTVFNCAAIVKHFSEGTEIEDVNIGGAQRCAEFCLANDARLIHISTASTRGIWVGENKDTIFTEQRLYMGQYLGNKYIHSKFMAERLILQSVATQHLDAKIMRVGNLAARSTDGEFQANFSTNSFMGRIRVYNMLGCCPYALRNKRVEFSPINEVSRAIVLLASTPKECVVFHPYNIHGQFLGDVLTGLTKVTGGIRFVEQEEFNEAMERAKEDPQKAKILSSLLAYQDAAHGQKTYDPARDNDYTTQVLYRLNFAFSPTSWDYVERMLTVIGGFGFFE